MLRSKAHSSPPCVHYHLDMQIDSIDIQVSSVRYRTLSNLAGCILSAKAISAQVISGVVMWSAAGFPSLHMASDVLVPCPQLYFSSVRKVNL